MEEFPIIKEGQVVVIRAEAATGHVFDINFQLSRADKNQKIYSVFNTQQEAEEYANEILRETTRFEFNIYDWQNNFIHCISANQQG